MHELSLCQAIADAVHGHAEERRLRRVSIRVGYLRQVVPDALVFSWQMITDGTDLEGCELDIEHVPAVIECRTCGERSELRQPLLVCPGCEGCDVAVVEGEELQIASIDVVEVVG